MKTIRTSLIAFVALAAVTGFLYPMLVAAVAQLAFPSQANGSLLRDGGGRVIGSELIGQPFSDPRYFWPRPSATEGHPYNPMASGGSNLGPTNPAFLRQLSDRAEALRDGGIGGAIPSDLAMASGSGLDPHLTRDGALVQVPRVAEARGIAEDHLREIVSAHLEGRQLGFMGRPRVNVVKVNRALDATGEGSHEKR